MSTPVIAALPIVSTLLAIGYHHAIKSAFKRKRPLNARISGQRQPSFPSGHATITSAFATSAAYLLLRERAAPARTVIPAAALLPAAVGLARVYDGRHWASDVVGGWLAGTSISSSAITVVELLDGRRSARSRHPSAGRRH